MFTLGYIPLLAIFAYIVVILALKGIIFSLYIRVKDGENGKNIENKNNKETKKIDTNKEEDKEKIEKKVRINIKEGLKDICINTRKIYIKYINIFSLISLVLVLGIFTYTLYARMLEKTTLSYIDVTKDHVYSINNKLKEEIKKLNKDVTDITIKYSVYPYKEELSKKEQQELTKSSNTGTTNTQNTNAPMISESRYNVETRIYNIIDVISKEISKTNKRIKYEHIEKSSELKLTIEYVKNGKTNTYDIDLSSIIFQNFNDYNIYSRVQEIYSDFFKNVNSENNKYTYGLIEEDKNILKREELSPIIDTVVENDMYLEIITKDMFKDISIDKYKVIIIPARKEDISEELLNKLMKFKEDGGNFIFFKMPVQEKKEEFKNLDKLISEYGITVPNNKLVLEQDNNHRYYIPEKAMGNNEKLIDNTIMIPDTTSNTDITKTYDIIKPMQKIITVTNGAIIKDSEDELKNKKVTINDIAKTSVNAKTVDGYVKEEITADTVKRGELRKCTFSGRND